MTASLVLAVLAVAVLDAINPSALAMTGYLLTLERPGARIRAYVTAIFLTYLALGVVVVFGVGDGVTAVVDALGRPAVGYSVQGLLGLAAIGFAIKRPGPGRRPGAQRAVGVRTTRQAFVLGVTVTALEATTALPYLGALTLIVRADASALGKLALLLAYNTVFVAPPVVLAAVGMRGEGLRRRLDARGQGTGRGRTVVRTLCAVVGVLLLADSATWAIRGTGLI